MLLRAIHSAPELCSSLVFAPATGANVAAAPAARVQSQPSLLLDTVVDGSDGGEGVEAQLQIKLAAAQVVHNAHLVPASRQVQGGGPTAVAIATCSSDAAGGQQARVGDQPAGDLRTEVMHAHATPKNVPCPL